MCQPLLKAAGEAGKAIGSPVVNAYDFVQDNWNRYLSPNRSSMQINPNNK
jgi:hypothetical protein